VPEAGTVEGPLKLTALVRDNLGDPLQGVGVNFITEAGTLASEGRLVQTDADGRAIDTLSATKSQLDTIPTNIFNVGAETAGIGGSLLEDTFQIRIENSEPISAIECTIVDFTGREVDCTFTGRSICIGPDFPGFATTTFDWSALPQVPAPSAEDPVTDGESSATFFLTQSVAYRISLSVTDGCGTDSGDFDVNLTP
jgi:hypothetical protein